MQTKFAFIAVFLFLTAAPQADAAAPAKEDIKRLIFQDDISPLKSYGKAAVDPLVDLYESGDETQKTKAANALYFLSEKSERAREVLMRDIHTDNPSLRLAVQWALGRVSSDAAVVSALLHNMQHDPNPLFRDKAACALAHDQVHLTEKQHALLLDGVVNALDDEKDDVRRIAITVLNIRTGQTKGYDWNASVSARRDAIAAWKAWVAEYKQNVGAP